MRAKETERRNVFKSLWTFAQRHRDKIGVIKDIFLIALSFYSLWLTWMVIIPLQEESVRLAGEKYPEVIVDVIPSPGLFIENVYHTQSRPASGDIIVDFYVLIWNMGNGSAKEVLIKLYASPQSSIWFDFHWSEVSLASFSYHPGSNLVPIKVLLPGQQAQIQYHVRFTPQLYDELLQQGEEPKIIVEVITPSAPDQRQEYLVRIP